ncbi:MAG: tetratricopeptide repeat protein [Pseudomonadota bacterium]
MAKPLDLEEQEQLDELKHFWKQYGNPITWVLIVVLAGVASWNGWNYWQRTQAAQASVLFDEVERAIQSGEAARVERALADIRDKFGRTTFAQQAQLLGARFLNENGKPEVTRSALTWVADKASDEGYQAIARLRLAAVLLDAKQYDDALARLSAPFPAAFTALAADRRGDVLAAQGKGAEALAAYQAAWAGLDARSEYRRMVEVKLNALGVDPQANATKAVSAAPTEVK